MKTVVLDGYTTNPGDLDWSALERVAETVVYDWTEPEEIEKRLEGAQAAITNKVRLDAAILSRLPDLKYIGILATGMDHVDLKAARERNITVTNVPVYANYSVAQLVFALILELCYRVESHHNSIVKDLHWSRQPYTSYWLQPLIGLEEHILGIIGMGRIGERVAGIATAFGMRVLAYDVYQRALPNVEWVSLEDLFSRSDFITIHCPLMDATRGMVNRKTLSLMKKDAYFINTSRGALVVEQDLADALNSGAIAGAALDVLSSEPPGEDNPLLRAKNCILTPHIGWATTNARMRLIQQAADNLSAYLRGEPINVVN